MFHAKLCARKLNFQGNYEGELLNEPSQTNFKCIGASNENDQSEVLCVLSRKVPIFQMENVSLHIYWHELPIEYVPSSQKVPM